MKKGFLVLLFPCFMFADIYYGECQACHGINFEKHSLGESRIVSTMSVQAIEHALIGYKNGTYGHSQKELMQQQVKKYSIQELKKAAKEIKIISQ